MSRAMARPKPGRAGILIARVIEPVEGAEHMLALGFGDAGPVVFDLRRSARRSACAALTFDMLGEARGVVDEVGDRALERMAAERHDQRALP